MRLFRGGRRLLMRLRLEMLAGDWISDWRDSDRGEFHERRTAFARIGGWLFAGAVTFILGIRRLVIWSYLKLHLHFWLFFSSILPVKTMP